MKRAVVLRPAVRDLTEISAYLEREAPRHSARHLDALLVALESLATSAARGPRPRDPILRRRGYRLLVHRPYLVFYKVVGRQVRVHRVVHGKRAHRSLL